MSEWMSGPIFHALSLSAANLPLGNDGISIKGPFARQIIILYGFCACQAKSRINQPINSLFRRRLSQS